MDMLRNADIGLSFHFQGMEIIKEINNQLDQTLSKFRSLGSVADGASNDFNKLGNDGKRASDSMNDSFLRVKRCIDGVTNSVRQANSGINGINDNRVQTLNRSISETNKIATSTRKTIESLQKNANGFKSDSIKSFGNSISKVGQQTSKTDKETGKATEGLHRFRDTALGVFAGNALNSGMQYVENNFKNIFETGLQVNSTIADMGTRWTQAGLNAQQKNGMLDQIQEIRRHSDISAVSINNMQRQFLSMTGSATQAMELTSSVTSFSKAGNLKPQQEQGLTRLMSSNKAVNARMFQRTLGSSPNFVNEIIKQTGMSKNAFYSLLQAGKFTGQELRNAMIKASKDSNKAWSEYAKTTTGKMDLVKATGNTIKNTFASNLASGAFNVVNRIAGNSKQLDDLQKRLTKTAKDAGKAIGNLIGSGVAFIAKNLKPIESMAGSLWKIVKALLSGAWTTITAPLKLISTHGKQASSGMDKLALRLKEVSKHQTALKVIGGTLVGMFATLKAMQGVILFDKFINSMKDISLATKGAFQAVKDFSFAEKAAAIQGKVMAGVSKIVAVGQWALNAAMDANPIGIIIVGVGALVAGLYELYKHFKPFRNLVNGTFKAIGKAIGAWWKQCQKNFKAVQKVIGVFAKFFKKYFANVIKDGVRNAKQAFKVIGDVIRVFKDIFTFNFKDLGKVIPKLMVDLWKLVKGIFKEGADFVEDIGSNMWKSIWNTFKGWGKAIGNFFKDLWNDIGNVIKSGINDVIDVINAGIKGVDWVLSKVGGDGHTIGTIKHLATGTVNGQLQHNTLAMLNDGHDSPQTGNKEMAILPNGRSFIPQKRNWVGMLPKGSMVLNATQTRELMALRGIQHFSIGSVAGDIWNGAKSVVGSLVNGVKKGAWAVMHPIKFIRSLFHGVKGMSEFVTDFTGGLANKTVNSVISFFKQHSGGADNPTGAGVERWKKIIEQAGSFMHESLSNSDISLIMKRIARESGGNATIKQQISDINSKAGHPAQGLLQYVPSTFASWAVKGHTNLLNGYDQLLAMFNDSNWRSDIANNGGWGPTGHRARKNGGLVSKNHWYKVNEEGFELFKPNTDGKVINHNDSKTRLGNINRKQNINIDGRIMNITINGNMSKEEIYDTFQQAHEDSLRSMSEKLQQSLGMNEDTGYYPI
ncbi:hypothetical protein DY042_05100 [Apilactobacillus kunkeei]|uniref:hypothetical protein n=1 Tax=Apilactobacillus kunkeei TaxID=148814 RepID=UPI00112B1B19|nr:hypothetical protein [Apilactobacillus kunkeei]TPR50729.1 hypothetical protein DY042_05100 [Apilactobacillus kunkeei]